MNFREFKADRAAKLAADPTLIDVGETHIWSALAELVPQLDAPLATPVHRRELARTWLAAYGLTEDWSARALVSTGVRNSLSMLFAALAQRAQATRQAARLWLPADAYPVYGDLARAAGLSYETFPTIPQLRLPGKMSDKPGDGDEWLLVPNPLKPAGRWLTDEETAELKSWLAASDRRRVVIDAVYTFELTFARATLELLASGQAILLHSFSKGWLREQVFGVALVPENDLPQLAGSFRANPPPPMALEQARQLLWSKHLGLRESVAVEIEKRRERLLNLLPAGVRQRILFPGEKAGYLMAVHASADELRREHHLLAIPLEVFGSPLADYCAISPLALKQV